MVARNAHAIGPVGVKVYDLFGLFVGFAAQQKMIGFFDANLLAAFLVPYGNSLFGNANIFLQVLGFKDFCVFAVEGYGLFADLMRGERALAMHTENGRCVVF